MSSNEHGMIPIDNIDKNWTLFLDRDGVINHEKNQDYIRTWEEFKFYDGAIEAIQIFSTIFNRVIVITNQRGVGKGLTTIQDLQTIHANMKGEIEKGKGKIDGIYYCPDLDESSPNRKPNIGMGMMAKKDFPDIDFSKSIMIGNSMSDMEFGKNLGCYTVFLPTTKPAINTPPSPIDMISHSLIEFSKILLKK